MLYSLNQPQEYVGHSSELHNTDAASMNTKCSVTERMNCVMYSTYIHCDIFFLRIEETLPTTMPNFPEFSAVESAELLLWESNAG